MANIKSISFNNFRNFTNYKLSLDKKINIFFGKNGSGKTNILEGLSLIAKGRGLKNSNISDLIKKNQNNFLINSILEINKNNYDIKIFSESKNKNFKKIIKINDDLSRDSLEFLDNSISYLIFLPEMERLFQASPTYRRNFLDRLIFSSRKDYNRLINKYKKSLLERVNILQSNIVDEDWLCNIEKEISILGLEIYKLRFSQLDIINNSIDKLKVDHNFQFNIHLNIKDSFFKTDLNFDEYMLNLKESRFYDKKHGGTRIGPHRSDIIAKINDEFEAFLLSTGQQKTLVLMILLAQCYYLVDYKNIKPILLLDEIGSHLDLNNRQILLEMINRFELQFFLTGTDKNLFSFISTNTQFYNITNI